LTESISSLEKIASLVPSTRYQGSKRRILPWLYKNLKDLEYDTVLDGFGGTGSVSYLFKKMGKKVTYNDFLLSNYQTGIAFIENDGIKLDDSDIRYLLHKNGFKYPEFIQETFQDIYYLDEENKWLDVVVHNINMLSDKYNGDLLRKKKSLALHILFQACIAKRPYNLFHRKNLYMRFANVKRSFSNKKMWDTPFNELFLRFSNEVTNKIFSNSQNNIAKCDNLLKFKKNDYDLVYFDPPYMKSQSDKPVDYYGMYHFLEGIVNYDDWNRKIDYQKKNRPLQNDIKMWEKANVEVNFNKIFNKFKDSTIVLSYGDPGYPSIKILTELLFQYKKNLKIVKKECSYALNNSGSNGRKSYEILIIAK
jgi:adenine-specific DNA-methyltransferase